MLIEHSKCNACYLCVNICPKNCIEMKMNNVGEMHPVINKKECIGCDICSTRCPELNPVKRHCVKKTYAAITNNLSQLQQSTSGGMASEIARYILLNGGIVYATVMEGMIAYFERISQLDDVIRIVGSKYIHSWLGDNLKKIKKDLINNRTVLVIGMPCQIASVRAYLGKEYINLYTIDLFCHGTPSQENFRCGIELETKKKEIKQVKFRDGKEYKLTIKKEDGTELIVPYRRSYWFNGFVEGYLFRECCYNCSYANDMRVGDISLGDFWGLESEYETNLDVSNGVNAVLINSSQGEKLFQNIKNNCSIEKHTLNEVKKYNHPLNEPSKKPKQYNKFKKLAQKYNHKVAIIWAYPKKSIYIFLRRCLSKVKILYIVLKKIPRISEKI